MNDAAAQALYDAERKGVRQIKGEYADGAGGLFAMGVLGRAVNQSFIDTRAIAATFGLYRGPDVAHLTCPCCGAAGGWEEALIEHLNDQHGLTFSEIARKLGPDAA